MKSVNEIANNVFRRRDEYLSQKKRRKIVFQRISAVIPIFLIVVLMMATLGTCYAFAVGIGIADDFLNFFGEQVDNGLSVSQQKYVEEAVAELGESVCCNDVTVTAKAAFTDGKVAYVLLDIIAPEETSLDVEGLCFETDFYEILRGENPERYLDAGSSRITYIPLEDSDNKTNTATLLIRVISVGWPGSNFSFADGYTRTLCLDTLSAYMEAYPYTKYTIAEGVWRFNFHFSDIGSQEDVEILSNPIQVQAIRGCSTEYMPVTVQSIRLRGLGLTLYYDVKAGETPEVGSFGPIKIQMKDGSVVNARSSMGEGLGKEYGAEYTSSYIVDAPIVLSEVDCVIINDEVTIPFNPADE